MRLEKTAFICNKGMLFSLSPTPPTPQVALAVAEFGVGKWEKG
jgi:hypothetical protein